MATTQTVTEKAYRTELTPVSFLRRSAAVFPDRIAVVQEDRRYTYREFEQRVNRLASALREAGLEKGDRVAFVCPNTPALLEAHYGVPAAGGVLVAVNYRLNADEVAYILGHSGARFVFVDHEFEALLAQSDLDGVEVTRIDDAGVEGDPYEDFLTGGSPEPPENRLEDEEETISINYTSGTTGRSKGVMYSHRGAYLSALSQGLEVELRGDSVFLWTLPMFHCNGWCFTWAVTAVGGRHVCLRKVEPERIWKLIDDERVTHYNGAPIVQSGMVNHPKAHAPEHGLTTCIGGAPPSPALFEKLIALNITPIHLYGLTETYGPITICEYQEAWDDLPFEERARLMARQGVQTIVADAVRVVDDDMNDVPRDGETQGELVMRGNNVNKGYFEQPDATEEAFQGGWFHSGDIAVWHPDGYVEIRDRKKDIIISGGENISTIEVEHALAKHPAVLEAAVVAMPDEKWGERPKAFVELREGEDVSPEELIAHCREHLARYKVPAAVEFTELPKTSTGKVQKFTLREKEWAGQQGRVGSGGG